MTSLRPGQNCPVCLKLGRESRLTQHQINFEEAVVLCGDKQCVFPMGYHAVSEFTINYTLAGVSSKDKARAVFDLPTDDWYESVSPFSAAVLSTVSEPETKTPASRKNVFLQWRNNNALCWLDVLLTLLVHCSWLRRAVDQCEATLPSTIVMLMSAYDQALALLSRKPIRPDVTTLLPSGGGTAKHELSFPFANGGNPILRKFFDSLNVYGLSGAERNKPEAKRLSSVLDYDSHLVPCLASHVPLKKSVDIVDKPEALVKLKRHLRDAASQYPSIDVRNYNQAEKLLNVIREEVWYKLHPLMQCEKGKNDSPLIALYVLLHTWTGESAQIGELFNIQGRWDMKCTKCLQDTVMNICDKAIVTFPTVKLDFCVNNAYFVRTCCSCAAANQRYRLVIDRMPECLMFHFMNGLPSSDMDRYEFTRAGHVYRVRAVVRYRNKPTDHFIAYVRDPQLNLWMECDDLKSPICSYNLRKLRIPASEIHLVMWERVADNLSANPSQQLLAAPEFNHLAPSSVSQLYPQNLSMDMDATEFDDFMDTGDDFLEMLTQSLDENESLPPCSSVSPYECLPGPVMVSPRYSDRSCPFVPCSDHRSVTPTSTPLSGSESGSHHARRKPRSPTVSSQIAFSQKSQVRSMRSRILANTSVDYVWKKLTQDHHDRTEKSATLKVLAQRRKCDTLRSHADHQNRLNDYLSNLKPFRTGSENFKSYSSKSRNIDFNEVTGNVDGSSCRSSRASSAAATPLVTTTTTRTAATAPVELAEKQANSTGARSQPPGNRRRRLQSRVSATLCTDSQNCTSTVRCSSQVDCSAKPKVPQLSEKPIRTRKRASNSSTNGQCGTITPLLPCGDEDSFELRAKSHDDKPERLEEISSQTNLITAQSTSDDHSEYLAGRVSEVVAERHDIIANNSSLKKRSRKADHTKATDAYRNTATDGLQVSSFIAGSPFPSALAIAPSVAPIVIAPSQAPIVIAPSQAPVFIAPSQAPVFIEPSEAPVFITPSEAPVFARASADQVQWLRQLTSQQVPMSSACQTVVNGTSVYAPVSAQGSTSDGAPLFLMLSTAPTYSFINTSENLGCSFTFSSPVRVTTESEPICVPPAQFSSSNNK